MLKLLIFAMGFSLQINAQTNPVTLTYGPHERNTLDFWRAPATDKLTPTLVYIHGGAWTSNDKSQIIGRVKIDDWLAKGVSVASIDYRYSTQAILPAPVYDAARAIQFLRSKAKELNIDSARIAVQGGSAGGCTCLWLAFHDDIANPASNDPVLRESSRVSGAYAQFPQTSIDPKILNEWIGGLAAGHSMITRAVGASNYASMMANYETYKPLFDEFSPINFIDAGDPPVFLSYSVRSSTSAETASSAIHHGVFGVKLKECADELGMTNCHLLITGEISPAVYETPDQFLEAVLLKK
ncbi:MAG: alpha/beta hydrolase [Kiritimatiellales bacterium]